MLCGALFTVTVCEGQAVDEPDRSYIHDVWTVEDGLPDSRIFGVIQTHDGYLWIGMAGGLARFDGVRFKDFEQDDSLQFIRGEIWDLVEDADSTLWIGSNRGLGRYRKGVFSAIDSVNGFPEVEVGSICLDREGRLWVGAMKGLYRRDGDRFNGYTQKDGLPGELVHVVQDADSGVWVSIWGMEHLWIGKTEGDGPPARWVDMGQRPSADFEGYPASNGGVWLVTGTGQEQRLGLYTATGDSLGKSRVHYTHREGLPEEAITSIYEDREGVLWIGTIHGVYRQLQGGFKRYDGLDGRIESFYEDREGSLWIGTYGAGLHRLRPGKFTTYGSEAGHGYNNINSILEDKKGTIWLGTRVGLGRLHEGRFEPFLVNSTFDGMRIFALHEERAGSLLAGGEGGLYRIQENGIAVPVKKGEGLTRFGVRVVEEGRDGALWIGTSYNGLFRLKNDHLTHFTTDDGLTNNEIRALHEDRRGSLWIGTFRGGLNRFENGRFISMNKEAGLLDNANISTFYQDVEGVLWIGTSHGLFRYENGHFTRFTTAKGLQGNMILDIVEDDEGNFWLSGGKGISRVSRQELEAVAAGEAERVNPIVYGTADGMRNREGGFGQPASLRDKKGRLWFATEGGVVMTDPANQPFNSLPPPVVIEEVNVDGEGIPARNGFRVDPDKKRLEFQYTGLSLVVPEKVRFRYKLEGFDRDWSEPVATRSVAYTNLPPGHFTFRVIAANNDGVWNEEGASLAVVVMPPWWRTTWAYVLYGFLFAAGVFAVDRVQRRRLIRREREKTRERELEQAKEIERAYRQLEITHSHLKATQAQLIQQEKLASLGQLTAGIAHEIKNPLNFVNNFSSVVLELARESREELKAGHVEVAEGLLTDLELSAGKIEEHGKRADGIVRSMLLHAKGASGERTVADLHALVDESVNLAYHSFRAQVPDFDCTIEKDFAPSVGSLEMIPQEIGRVLLNLLGNAFYAVHEKVTKFNGQYAPEVKVSTRRTDDIVEIRIEDNGPGIPESIREKIFEPFFTTKPTGQGTGLGLSLAYDIVTQGHGGKLEVENIEGKGALFVIRLPYKGMVVSKKKSEPSQKSEMT